MSSNQYKNSKPEIILRKELWNSGLRGYRLHFKKIAGRPDITFVSRKIAIFVNGCFWHRCPICKYDLPKHNTAFWKSKFKNNVRRDKEKVKKLKEMNWNVITVWECEIKNSGKINKKSKEIRKLFIKNTTK